MLVRAARLFDVLALAQVALAARVLWRMARSARAPVIRAAVPARAQRGRVSVLVPVLDEERRIGACLEGVILQGPEVGEILVVDGGSGDGTRSVVSRYVTIDPRVHWVPAGPIPPDWNGKAWGLQAGLEHVRAEAEWILTIDADVRIAPTLAGSLLAHARAHDLAALSVATRQELSGVAEGLVHPALLATLVYRFGIPGPVARDVHTVQANGQCMLLRRDLLTRHGGFAAVRDSVCEDVTLARLLVSRGERVAMREAGELARVRMYDGAGDAWRNWTRSLPMRDRFSNRRALLGLAEVTLVQGVPFPLLALAVVPALAGGRRRSPLGVVNLALVLVRLGVLAGMARAYAPRPWTYWLSPLLDLPAAAALWHAALRRHHTWRGRPIVRG